MGKRVTAVRGGYPLCLAVELFLSLLEPGKPDIVHIALVSTEQVVRMPA